MVLENNGRRYKVLDLRMETSKYRTYLCEDVDSAKLCLLQIPVGVTGNGDSQRACFVLKILREAADEYQAQYELQGHQGQLNYNLLFPRLLDSFIATEQSSRMVNIVDFTAAETSNLIPLSSVSKASKRLELSTSAWIMGRLLKLLGFAHEQGIAVRALVGGNILIEPAEHLTLVFDWSSAMFYQSEVPMAVCKDDIASAAKTVLVAIGANTETGVYPYLLDDEQRYIDFLWRLASRRESDAQKAHEQFYKLVEELWGRKFREFVALPL